MSILSYVMVIAGVFSLSTPYVVEVPPVEPVPTVVVVNKYELPAPHYLDWVASKSPELLPVAREIIFRESRWRPDVCNMDSGCKSGQGLFQLIPTTVLYCEAKLQRKINPFDQYDNIDCGWWLLENEGIRHWEAWSGSYCHLYPYRTSSCK